MRAFLVLLTLLIAAFVGYGLYGSNLERQIAYEKQPIRKGNVTERVAVTGSAEPHEIQHVQGEVMGIVTAVAVDFNDETKKGQVLAKLASDMQEVQVKQAKAGLDQARIAVEAATLAIESANFGLKARQADLDAARSSLQKLENLPPGTVPNENISGARSGVEKAMAGVEEAATNVKRAQAAKQQAMSMVSTAEIQIELAELQLQKMSLQSPMDGFVLNMDIRVGDTVGRPKISLGESTGALFTIAAHLDSMRAIVKVSEADYSRVAVNQSASFSVDAYPGEVFIARVAQLRNTPSSERGGVTYAAVLEFKNRLDIHGNWMVKPSFTVSADIKIREAVDVLLVPNDALLFLPTNYTGEAPVVEGENQAIVWLQDPSGRLEHRTITKGISDGTMTEVLAGDLKEGDLVITSEPFEKPKSGFKLDFAN